MMIIMGTTTKTTLLQIPSSTISVGTNKKEDSRLDFVVHEAAAAHKHTHTHTQHQ
jgi:hypothetical protein